MDAVEAAIGPKARAIVLPDTIGNPFDVEEVAALAKKQNYFHLRIIATLWAAFTTEILWADSET